ncbi:MAG: helix-turn-helix transcriptional regulator, partial [Clostridiales bacterium]|nr:helix-turn-helix transcriptional regulator [Clostridiales bacterium]
YNPRDRQDFAQLFPDFPRPFCLAMIRIDEDKKSIEEMAHIFTAMLQAAHAVVDRIYYAHMLANGGLLLVLSESQPEALETLREKLLNEMGFSVHGVLGQPYQDSADLPAAFDQLQCMELMPSSSNIVSYADFDAAENSHVAMPLTFSALHEMYGALSTGNETLARIILNDCTDTLLRHPDQLMMARHTHSMISHMLAQLKMEYPTALFSVVIPAFDAGNLEYLFRNELPSCLHAISLSLMEMQSEEADLPTNVLQFINDNIFSNELCVTYVADRFGIAKATLQKIIKVATGTTFSVYVGTQRLERAYRLMQEPGVSVQRVSEMCGFSSTNSFYKAFRRKYGVAPSAVTGVPDSEEEKAELEQNLADDPLDD